MKLTESSIMNFSTAKWSALMPNLREYSADEPRNEKGEFSTGVDSDKKTSLWKYNKITGYWNLQRTHAVKNADAYQKLFQQDAPNEVFRTSVRAPKGKPKGAP